MPPLILPISDQEHSRPRKPVWKHPEGLWRGFLQRDGPQLRGWPPWCRARFVFFIFTFMYKVTIMIYLYSYFSGEASGSVCGMGGVKRKRADSGHLMEVDHNHHPKPQRPSKKWSPKILWFSYSKHLERCHQSLIIPFDVDFIPILWFPIGPSVTFE